MFSLMFCAFFPIVKFGDVFATYDFCEILLFKNSVLPDIC